MEFPRALQKSVRALIVLHEEADSSVRARADEALTVIVKVKHSPLLIDFGCKREFFFAMQTN
jgi:hypothetical protein